MLTNDNNNSIEPAEAFYPVDRLQIFDRHDRGSWERSSGEQAPPWDKRRRTKAWADPSVLSGVSDPDNTFVEYDYFDRTKREFKKMKLSVREAATPNIPGEYVYPKYVSPPSPAVVRLPDGGEDKFNPKMMSHRAEADMLARELGATSVVESQFSASGPFQIEWRGEQRRIWLLRIGVNLFSAGLLLERKYRYGIGAPGEWVISEGGQPLWIRQRPDDGTRDARPEIAIPSRLLADNEALYLGHPMKAIVYRTDMESEFNQPEGGSTGFPPELRATLERIDANLQQLLALSLVDR